MEVNTLAKRDIGKAVNTRKKGTKPEKSGKLH
jgi:hypothetical protein